MRDPLRGEIWTVDLNPAHGHEQAGTRPALVLSADTFNHGPSGLVVVLPITRRDKRIPLHVPVEPPGGGLKVRSFIKCEDIRAIARERLTKRHGSVSLATMQEVADRVTILLDL